MAIIYIGKGDYDVGMDYYTKSLKIREELDDKRGACIAIGNMANTYMDRDDYDAALDCFNRAIVGHTEVGYKYGVTFWLLGKADCLFRKKQLSDAKKSAEECIELSTEFAKPAVLSPAKVLLAKIDFAKGNQKRAIQNLLSMLKEAEKDSEKADLHYELWKMLVSSTSSGQAVSGAEGSEQQHQDEALAIYKKIYEKTPSIDYKKRIEELEKPITEIVQKEEARMSEYVKTDDMTIDETTSNYYEQLHLKLESLQEVAQNELIEMAAKVRELERRAEYPLIVDGSELDRIKSFTDLLNIIRKLNSNLRLEELLQGIVDLSIEFIGADQGVLLLYNEEGKLENHLARDLYKRDLQEIEYNISQTVLRKVIQSGMPLFEPDISESKEISNIQSVIQLQLQSVMCLPLGRRFEEIENERRLYSSPTGSQLLGILYLDSRQSEESSRFNASNLDLVQALADQASIALINTLLYEKSNVDALTRLYLRPYFEDALKNELRFCHEIDGVLSVMMLDIDFFKLINDRYGHQVGDEVLSDVGQLLLQTIRSSDVCARYGGEEFAIILPNTDILQAEIIAQKVRQIIRSHSFSCGQVTISLGLSNFPNHVKDDDLNQATRLLKCADQALYRAKDNGRDQYVIWNPRLLKTASFFTSATEVLTGDPVQDHKNVEMLLDAARTAGSTLDYDELLVRIIDMILNLTGAERGILILMDKQDHLRVEVARTQDGNDIEENTLIYSRSIPLQVMETGEPVSLREATGETATMSMMDLELRSVMCLPLEVNNKRFGVIYVDSRADLREFSTSELSFFHILISQIAGTIEHARVHNEVLGKLSKVFQELGERNREIKEANQKLVEAQEQIIKLEKEALEKQMAGGFAHEMRNALSGAIMVLSSFFSDDRTICQVNSDKLGEIFDRIEPYIPSDDVRNDLVHMFEDIESNEANLDEALKMVQLCNTRAMKVTTLILEYSKLGKTSAGDEKIKLSQLIKNIVSEHQDRFLEHNITFDLKLSAQQMLKGSKLHFHSIINNIVINARDAIIEVQSNQKHTVKISLYEKGNYQILNIQDDGCGISEENLENIFEPFFSTKPTTGTGLGLSVVLKLVSIYEGKIDVKSKTGRGTIFRLTFPV